VATATARIAGIERVVRALSSAGKSLRLYPPTSPIPQQSVDAVVETLNAVFADGLTELSLVLDRDGLTFDGEPICENAAGVDDLITELKAAGVASVTFTPSATAQETHALLSALMLSSDASAVGLSEMLAREGVTNIRLAEVQLTIIDPMLNADGQDTDEFLRDLSQDPAKLAAWFAGAAAGDPRSFEESLMELVRVSGPSGFGGLLAALAQAFVAQDSESKDVLIGLALDDGPTRDLTGAMFALLESNEIAASVLGGAFGRNMLSLSNALTRLPLEQVTAEVRAEVQALLPNSGHSPKEAAFLTHMIEVREQAAAESPLAERDRTYQAVIEAAQLNAETIAGARDAVVASGQQAGASGVRTMLALIGQQQDFALYCRGMESLSGMVPLLIEQRDLELAKTVLSELSKRENVRSSDWPELPERVDAALAEATGPRSMSALVRVLLDEPTLVPAVRDFLRLARGAGNDALVSAAIDLKGPGIAIAEQLLGGRFEESLGRQALTAQWHQLSPIAARLAMSGSPFARKTLGLLMLRPDEQSRREVALGLGEAGTELAVSMLGAALSDPSTEVVLAAARGLGRSASPAAAVVVSQRLGQIDIDNDDFDVVVELIGALAQLPGSVADETLSKLATRRGFMKRARHGEIQDLVNRARAYRSQAGGAA